MVILGHVETQFYRRTFEHRPLVFDVNEEENERPAVVRLFVTERTFLRLFCLEKTSSKNPFHHETI